MAFMPLRCFKQKKEPLVSFALCGKRTKRLFFGMPSALSASRVLPRSPVGKNGGFEQNGTEADTP